MALSKAGPANIKQTSSQGRDSHTNSRHIFKFVFSVKTQFDFALLCSKPIQSVVQSAFVKRPSGIFARVRGEDAALTKFHSSGWALRLCQLVQQRCNALPGRFKNRRKLLCGVLAFGVQASVTAGFNVLA